MSFDLFYELSHCVPCVRSDLRLFRINRRMYVWEQRELLLLRRHWLPWY